MPAEDGADVAWMQMMGIDSVAYHRATVLARGDDHPGQALAYYTPQGETPLLWGGRGAVALGLTGAVTDGQYDALFGRGGACDPTAGERLVTTKRPGLELVISAHKSAAELGVICRAEDMHPIMDAERYTTLAYLDDLTVRIGGRRRRAMDLTATGGLIFTTTRHATSRAGDPAPHDHVLIANLVRMEDDKGGWRAADTALWREHLHAATMVGGRERRRHPPRLPGGVVAGDRLARRSSRSMHGGAAGRHLQLGICTRRRLPPTTEGAGECVRGGSNTAIDWIWSEGVMPVGSSVWVY